MAASVLACASVTPALAAVARLAVVQGVDDRGLRLEIERAIGDERTAVDSRLEARRRARDAALSATALLRSEGYYGAEATPDIGEGDHPTPLVKVTLGQRFGFTEPQVEWIGDPPSPEARAAVQVAMNLNPGQPGRAADVLAAEGAIVAALELYGYADAKPDVRRVMVDYAAHAVRPTFRIIAGPAVKLGAVKLQTKGRSRPGYIAALAPWKPGAPYRPNDVAELERRLLDPGVYDQVTVALAPADEVGPDGLRPVIVSLADRDKHSLEVSAGYSTTEGGDLDLRYSFFNPLGRADTLAFEARYGDLGSRLGVDLSLPHWRTPGTTLKLTLEGFHDTTDAYNQTGEAIRGDLTHRFGKDAYFTRGISLVRTRVDDLHTGIADLVYIKGLLALALDHSNDPLNPTRGWRAEARAEPTAVTGDNGLIYTKAQVQVTGYLPLEQDADTVIAGRIKFGSIAGGRFGSVPAFDRFYAGGGGSVRGFDYQGVGPKYPDGTPQGGLSLTEGSLEVRQHVAGAFGLVAFADAGAVGTAVDPSFNNMRYSVGLGLRYKLPFAPLRFDVATPLDRQSGEGLVQVYVSIGQSF